MNIRPATIDETEVVGSEFTYQKSAPDHHSSGAPRVRMLGRIQLDTVRLLPLYVVQHADGSIILAKLEQLFIKEVR